MQKHLPGAEVSHSNRTGQKLTKLEATRGFAAVYVALGHIFSKKFFIAGHDLSFLLRFGQEAVILFFLLSGFVIQYSYTLSKDKSFKTYFIKRFLRIYIPLIAVFVANYFFLANENNQLISIDGWNFAGNLLMLQDTAWLKPNVITDCFLGNAPLWSLSYEWWFYMLFFLITTRIKRNSAVVVYAIGIISALTYVIYPNFINRELMYLVIWWAGAEIATLYIQNSAITLRAQAPQLLAVFVITCILAVNVQLHRSPSTTIGMSPFLELRHFAFTIVIIAGAVWWKKLRWVGFNSLLGPFERIAPISFGLYISHWFLVANAHYLDTVVKNAALRYCVYIAICLAFSYLIERIIYLWLNKQIMRILKKGLPSPPLSAPETAI